MDNESRHSFISGALLILIAILGFLFVYLQWSLVVEMPNMECTTTLGSCPLATYCGAESVSGEKVCEPYLSPVFAAVSVN